MTFADCSLGDFLDAVASTAVSPSGGAVAAVAGASGAALCEMACLHTGYASETGLDEELSTARTDLESLRSRLLELADEDAAAVDALQDALKNETSEDVSALSRRATTVPLDTAAACLDVLDHARVVVERASDSVAPDAVTGAVLAHAALRATTSTARSNCPMLDDPSVVADVEARADEIETGANAAMAAIDEIRVVDYTDD